MHNKNPKAGLWFCLNYRPKARLFTKPKPSLRFCFCEKVGPYGGENKNKTGFRFCKDPETIHFSQPTLTFASASIHKNETTGTQRDKPTNILDKIHISLHASDHGFSVVVFSTMVVRDQQHETAWSNNIILRYL